VAGIGAFAGAFSMLSQGEAWIMPGTGAWLTLLLKKDGVQIEELQHEATRTVAQSR
jgi:spermidine/putrescine transport system substrate-binding protein